MSVNMTVNKDYTGSNTLVFKFIFLLERCKVNRLHVCSLLTTEAYISWSKPIILNKPALTACSGLIKDTGS